MQNFSQMSANNKNWITILILKESADGEQFVHGIGRFFEEIAYVVSRVIEISPNGRIVDQFGCETIFLQMVK